MIDLYAAGTSNGVRARIALEECGLPYTLHLIALDKGEHKTAAFLAMNPQGQIPVIVDRDGPGGRTLTLAQSTAILIYCAEKSGRFMPQDRAARAAVLQALMSGSTDVTPYFGAASALTRLKEPHPPAVQLLKDRLRAMFKVWDDTFATRRQCAGDEVSIADLSLYPGYWRVKGAMPEVVDGFADLSRWAEAMAARPAIQRALQF